MARKIRISFERGGEVTATLLEDEAPETCNVVWDRLPVMSEMLHTRWCGREVNWAVDLGRRPPRENQTITSSVGNVVYWREWDGLYPSTGAEALAVYYGAELIRDHRGHQPVNVFAQVDTSSWGILREVGHRVWRRGAERVTVTRVEHDENPEERELEGKR
ncbi:MAG: DUF3830 family protein [Actinobacteria bacterium]|nr:DUF3830 family protein [Actinomycetota bacterium]